MPKTIQETKNQGFPTHTVILNGSEVAETTEIELAEHIKEVLLHSGAEVTIVSNSNWGN